MDFLSAMSQQMNLWQEYPISNLKECVASADVAKLRKQLKQLTAAGVIKEYKDMKLSPLAAKKTVNKEVRFCLDYQHFTQRTVPDLYSDRKIEEGLNCLVGKRFFDVFAMISGICQLPTFPGERDDPYAVRPLGFYEHERMHPGFCENLAKYQRRMEDILDDLHMEKALAYLDYVIVFGKTFDELCLHHDIVYKRFQNKGFRVSQQYSFYSCDSVCYAGHGVSEKGISIDWRKIIVLTKWPKPSTVSELRCYVDFCRYYQQFISGFQKIAKPLNRLLQDAADHKAKNPGGPWWTKESIEERWTEECDEAFAQLKDCLLKAPLLARANMTQRDAQDVEPENEPDAAVMS